MTAKHLIGLFIVLAFLCAGLYFYTEWSNRRFAEELGEIPTFAPSAEPAEPTAEQDDIPQVTTQTGTVETPETIADGTPDPLFAPDPVLDALDAAEMVEVPVDEPSESGFDAAPFLTAFGVPEEVTALFDESVDAEAFQEAESHLIEEYGASPEVEAIIQQLKQMSTGPVELDALIGLFEAWVQVLPPEDQENRRQLIEVLTKLDMVRSLGGDSEIRIEVEYTEED